MPEAEQKGRQRGAAGTGEVLRRGMGREVGGRASGLRGRAEVFGRACRCAGRGKVFGGEWVVRAAGNALRTAGVHRAACGRASGLHGGAEVLGKGVSLCGRASGLRGGGRKCSGRA